ncbi:hypothetical protein PINS_up020659 [Pythium insidiosum]|nr:hypothetical protein PINS_up020659 [Pythium insidiosum]
MTVPMPQQALSPLLLAVDAWKQQRGGCEIAPRLSRASCARLCALVPSCDRSSIDDAACGLAELLRVVELLTRPGVDPLALHRLRTSYAPECSMEQQWCSYCDGVDRQVQLRLSPPISLWQPSTADDAFLAVVRAALFDWDDSTASPEFLELRSLVFSVSRGAQRSQPIKLEINVDSANNTMAHCHDLASLLGQLANASDWFELELYHRRYLNRRAMALIAASRLPLEVTALELWQREGGENNDDNEEEEEEEDGVALLMKANTKVLAMRLSPTDPRFDRLMDMLHTRSSQLKRLDLAMDVRELSEDRSRDLSERRREVMETIGQALFGSKSSLRLDELILNAPIGQRDLEFLVASAAVSATHTETSETFHHRSVVLQQFELSEIRGASLGRLLSLSGGVHSLRLHSTVTELKIAELLSLLRTCPTLRELRVAISCSDWDSIPADDCNASIEALELDISDRDPVPIASAIEKLLRVVGRSLVSLGIVPSHRHATLNASLATIIAQHCSRLEQLSGS